MAILIFTIKELESLNIPYTADDNNCSVGSFGASPRIGKPNKISSTMDATNLNIVMRPNPGTGIIYIEASNSILKAELYDMAGKKMDCLNILVLSTNKLSFESDCLSAGVYNCKVYSTAGSIQ